MKINCHFAMDPISFCGNRVSGVYDLGSRMALYFQNHGQLSSALVSWKQNFLLKLIRRTPAQPPTQTR